MQHPDLRLALPLRRCGPGPGAFTLVEMLVVICIMAIIAALAFGSLFGTVGHNRLLATEQLIADSVRQARHTARSTGQPAVLTITPVMDDAVPPKVIGGRIAGTSRICVWSETFDEPESPQYLRPPTTSTTAWPAIQDAGDVQNGPAMVVGRTGMGVVVGNFQTGSSLMQPLTEQPLERSLQIVRGAGPGNDGKTTGFYLTCSVRPPSAQGQAAGTVIPLLMVGDALTAGASQCGLCLVSSINNVTTSPVVAQATWEIDGWVTGTGGSPPVHLMSLDEPTRVSNQPPSPSSDIPDPIGGGEWIDVGLLYVTGADGATGRMALFLDGRRISEMAQTVGPPSVPVPAKLVPGDTVFIGRATFNPVIGEVRSPAPIDDACLYRVGTDQVGNLPSGVIPTGATQQGAQIVAMPDGRIQVQRLGAPTDGTNGTALTFEELNAPQQTHVEIAIDARGVVSSNYVVPGAPQ